MDKQPENQAYEVPLCERLEPAAPPSKPWVSLTDKEIINTANEAPFDQIVKADDYIYIIARAIETALRSKNDCLG